MNKIATVWVAAAAAILTASISAHAALPAVVGTSLTAIQEDGYGEITRMIRDLEDWLAGHGYTDIGQVRGAALPSLMPFEDIKPQRRKAAITEPCDIESTPCNICINGCLYDAIARKDGCIEIHAEDCEGCGLCSSGCPRGIISLGW